LAEFNSEYCDAVLQLANLTASGKMCTDPVQQEIATIVLAPCPFWQDIVPRLYADVDRVAYRTLVVTTIEPFVSALRAIVLDCIWFVAYVVIAVAILFILSTVMYYSLVLVHMIRVRKARRV